MYCVYRHWTRSSWSTLQYRSQRPFSIFTVVIFYTRTSPPGTACNYHRHCQYRQSSPSSVVIVTIVIVRSSSLAISFLQKFELSCAICCFAVEISRATEFRKLSSFLQYCSKYTVSKKKRATCLWRYLHQILTDVQNFFTAGKPVCVKLSTAPKMIAALPQQTEMFKFVTCCCVK